MRTLHGPRLAAFIVAAGLAMVAWTQDSDTDAPGTSTPDGTSAATGDADDGETGGNDLPDVIRVGVPLDTSGPIGPVAEIGQSELEGVRLAAAEINETDFLEGSTIELVEVDTVADKDEAIGAVLQLLDEDVDGVVGFTLTSSFLAAGPELEAAGIPTVTVGLAGPGVEEMGEYIFRTYPNVATDLYPESDQRFVEAFGATTASSIYAGDSDPGVAANEARHAAMEEIGVEWLSEYAVSQADTDFRTALTEVADDDPDVLFLNLVPTQISAAAVQAAELGIDAQLISVDGSQGPTVLEAGGDAMQCMVFTGLWSELSTSGRNPEFLEWYDANTSRDRSADTFVASAYDALWVFATAVQDAGTVDGDAVRDAIAALDDFQGALGAYDYTAAGDGRPSLTGLTLQIQDGAAVLWDESTTCT